MRTSTWTALVMFVILSVVVIMYVRPAKRLGMTGSEAPVLPAAAWFDTANDKTTEELLKLDEKSLASLPPDVRAAVEKQIAGKKKPPTKAN